MRGLELKFTQEVTMYILCYQRKFHIISTREILFRVAFVRRTLFQILWGQSYSTFSAKAVVFCKHSLKVFTLLESYLHGLYIGISLTPNPCIVLKKFSDKESEWGQERTF